jgi:PAS domain S-box-containing protein
MSAKSEFLKSRNIGLVIVVAGAYFLSAELGLSLAFLNASVSPVWPPTGVAIALVWWLGYRVMPGVFLGALVANLLLTHVPLATDFGIAVGNTAEAFTAVYLLRRSVGSRDPFNRATDVLRFLLFAVIISTAIAATIGNVSLCLGGAEKWENFKWLWLTWWLGDGVGAMVVAPLILTWIEHPVERWSRRRWIEGTILLIALWVLSATIYTNLFLRTGSGRPWGHITIPLLLWAGLRFGPRGVATAIASFSAIAIWGTINGFGTFAGYGANDGLLYLQAYVLNLAITMLLLAAMIMERRHAERHLSGSLSVTRILAESPELKDALPGILQRICATFDWEVGAMWIEDRDNKVLRTVKVWPPQGPKQRFEGSCYEITFASGVGLPGRVWKNLKPAWISDVTTDDNFPRGTVAAAEGLRSAFAFPILSGQKFLGVMEFFSREIREPDESLLAAFRGIGSQIGEFMEKKGAEEALRQNREWLRLTMEGSLMGTWTRDLDGSDRVLWSPELERTFGLQPGEFSQTEEAFFEFIHPDDRQRLADAVRHSIENRVDYDVEFRYLRKDGTTGWMLGRGRAFYDEIGKPYRLAGLGWDISERKKAEVASRHLAAIVESTDDVIISKDLNGIITSWNAAAEKLYGYSAEEMIGQPISILIPPDRPDEEPGILALLRQGERIDQYETVRLAKDGTLISVALTISPIRNASGEVIGASKIARDITQKKRAEEEREQLLAREQAARGEAEIANRTKDEFLATLSHELRTPLTAMLGWLSMLRSHRLDKKTTEHAIETIERNTKIQAQLIEDLMDVSRIIGGKLNMEMRPVDLSQVIDAALEIVRPAANAKGITLRPSYHPEVELVSGDPARLQQIVWNLLSNAVKFTSRDGIVEVLLRKSGRSAEIVVRDTGIGIAAEFLPYVFDRFRQAESSLTRSHRGLGLGLAIVRHLVELHGGGVSAESPGENQGATFTIRLPLVATQSRSSAPANDDGVHVEQALAGLRVLVVEDEPDSRELISLALKRSGAVVTAVGTARDALSNMQVFAPDVLLSDIGLPVESGYDLIREVRGLSSKLNNVPAIALTAFASESDRKMALSSGFHAHLAKPIEPNHLVEMIRRLVRGTF